MWQRLDLLLSRCFSKQQRKARLMNQRILLTVVFQNSFLWRVTGDELIQAANQMKCFWLITLFFHHWNSVLLNLQSKNAKCRDSSYCNWVADLWYLYYGNTATPAKYCAAPIKMLPQETINVTVCHWQHAVNPREETLEPGLSVWPESVRSAPRSEEWGVCRVPVASAFWNWKSKVKQADCRSMFGMSPWRSWKTPVGGRNPCMCSDVDSRRDNDVFSGSPTFCISTSNINLSVPEWSSIWNMTPA